MSRYRNIRKIRGSRWTSASSKAANAARWSADRARRDAEEPRILRELAEIEAINLPRHEGDAIGCLQWTDYRTGKVRRWVMRVGDRADRMTVDLPDGKQTSSHGWTWILTTLRKHLSKH